ncbi:NAD(P)/FAD-dependent oxidoreductase [Acetonema longum]|uniref:Oxidoreductase, fad-dependent n=1 Tax=Acetonema longum DSM 6540 TaxID=1009370 RepID=F7NP57_9FIRM|nr:NAD(P)/FAD-dependent oxidoreductase [Acetonema longum]EGO62180.1 oxidoreductase, fad-dependent [Acetonema longum DSM 6540]
MTGDKVDVAVIGAGIVGAAIARELSRFQVTAIVLEAQPDVAMGTSKANSAILHAGFDAKPGSLKAELNVRGNELYHQMEKELDLHIAWTGSMVAARGQEGMAGLEELQQRGQVNGVPDLQILSKEEVLSREPNLSPEVTGALWAPTAGIICPFGATIAFMENAIRNGIRLFSEATVRRLEKTEDGLIQIHSDKGRFTARYVINAAGLHADEISRLAGDDSFRIRARKGEYVLFDKTAASLIHTVLFPVPGQQTKGILVAPTVHGNMFIGPDAQDSVAKDDISVTAAGMERIIAGAGRLVPNLPLAAAITTFAGNRAIAEGDGDFIIRPSDIVPGLIQVAGIQSPGLTAAPAIAEKVVSILADDGLKLAPKAGFIAANPPKPAFNAMTMEQRQKLVQENPLHGRIICRCETVTEGEIVAAIHSPCGARTIDGVKRRTRAGSGRCQGGFCGPRVTAILARELGIPVTQVRKDDKASYIFYEKAAGSGVKADE